jgi:hypothetical protein
MARQAATDAPHVSVVVLVYNEVDSVEPLHRELMGVLAALGTSFEVLYIDDGSRDGSTEKLGQIASRDGRGSITAEVRCSSSWTATCGTTRTTSRTSCRRSTRAMTW